MHAVSRRYQRIILLVLSAVTLVTGIALIFGFLYRPDNEDLSRAGSFAGVIGTTLGVLIAAYAIFIEYQRAELRHEEANAAWAAAIRLRYAIASLDWMLPDAGQNAWIVASACRPNRPGTAWVVRELGSAGLPGTEGDSYLAGLCELREATSLAISTGIGRVLGVAWDSETWTTQDLSEDDLDDSRGVLAVRPLVELEAALGMLIKQRRVGLMALPDAFTLAQLQALFRALNDSRDDDESSSGFKTRKPKAPNLTLMHEFRRTYEDDRFEGLASDTYLAFFLEEYGTWMGQLLPYVGLALPFPGKNGHADWVPVGESDRFKLESARPSISPFFAWRPDRPFADSFLSSTTHESEDRTAVRLTPHVWDASALAARLKAASGLGDAESSNALGVLYACLKPRNYAFGPLELAVQQGSISAKANLGLMHYGDAVDEALRADGANGPQATKSWNEAVRWFMQVLEEDREHPQALMFGGLLAYEADEMTDAEAYFRRAFGRGVLPAAGALMTMAAKRGDIIAAIQWRDAQAEFLNSYRADDPLDVLATLWGYALEASPPVSQRASA